MSLAVRMWRSKNNVQHSNRQNSRKSVHAVAHEASEPQKKR